VKPSINHEVLGGVPEGWPGTFRHARPVRLTFYCGAPAVPVVFGEPPVVPVELPVDVPVEPAPDVPIEPLPDAPIEPPLDVPIEPLPDVPLCDFLPRVPALPLLWPALAEPPQSPPVALVPLEPPLAPVDGVDEEDVLPELPAVCAEAPAAKPITATDVTMILAMFTALSFVVMAVKRLIPSRKFPNCAVSFSDIG
jgi:hypothetical protein